ncbi:MAG: type I restriction enzyme HsdR N-terminal domain-containing protein [Cytophagales bacterium]
MKKIIKLHSSFQVPPLPHNWSPEMTIKDPVRKKNLKLTPEEWVRQHAIIFLNQFLEYPLSLMSVEKSLKFNKLSKRTDLVIFKENQPFILLECKAQSQKLNTEAWMQTFCYQSELNATFFTLTNGKEHIVFQKLPNGTVIIVEELPKYSII